MLAIVVLYSSSSIAMEIEPSKVEFSENGEIETPLTEQPGDPIRGVEVMVTRGLGNCIACHKVTELQDYPFHGEVGPTLDGVATKFAAPELRGIVVNAKKTFPDSMMPSFYHMGPYIRPGDGYTGKLAKGDLPPLLTAQDVEDVVAYLLTLDKFYDE